MNIQLFNNTVNNISNETRQTSMDILAQILVNFVIKITDLNALLSFYSHLALPRGPKSFKRYITFLVSSPLVRRVKATYSKRKKGT